MNRTLSIIGCVAMLLVSAAPSHAQADLEEIRLPLGSVFEIGAITQLQFPSYNWTFTRDGDFLQAGREDFFRTRLVTEGTYVLDAEVRDAQGTASFRKQFQIRVRASSNETDVSGPGVIASTDPKTDEDGYIELGKRGDVVRFTPTQTSDDHIILDLDALTDADGDGTTTNDQDAADTFFSEDHTPLYLWFAQRNEEQRVAVSLEGSNTTEIYTIVEDKRDVQEENEPEQEPELPTNTNRQLRATELEDGKVRFELDISNERYSDDPVLLQWSFGDGHQSLLDTPIHAYIRSGTYRITVQVRDLSDGTIREEFNSSIRIEVDSPPPPISDDSGEDGTDDEEPTPPTDEDDEKPEEPKKSGGALRGIILILAGVAGAIAFGFVVVMIIGVIKRKGGLQGALSKVEEKIAPSESSAVDSIDAPPPMALDVDEEEQTADTQPELEEDQNIVDVEPVTPSTEPEPVNEPPAYEEPAPAVEPEPVVEPQIPDQSSEADAPNWLKDGMAQAAVTGQTEDSPPPPSLQSDPPPVQEYTEPTQVSESPVEEPVVEPPQPVVEPAPPPPEPTPEPVPQEPTPPQEPVTPEQTVPEPVISEPEPTPDAPVPDWLQEGMEQADEEGQTMASPPPEPLQESTVTQEVTPPVEPQQPPVEPIEEPITEPEASVADEGEEMQSDGSDDQAKDWSQMTPEEREKERKRQKRRRYRQNKKRRIKEEREQEEGVVTSEPAPNVVPPVEEPTPPPAPNVEEIPTEPVPEVVEQPIQEVPTAEPAPVEQEIEPATSDDEVEFLIRADSIEEQQEDEQQPPQTQQ